MMSISILAFLVLHQVQDVSPADTFCALRVEIFHLDGTIPALGGKVLLLDGADKVIGSFRATDGTVEICDLGFGTFSVVLETSVCVPTKVIGLRSTTTRKPQLLRLFQNICFNGEGEVFPESCSVYFRAKDRGSGKPLAGVEISAGVIRIATDSYGRAFLAQIAGPADYSIRFQDGTTTSLSLFCKDYKRLEQEIYR